MFIHCKVQSALYINLQLDLITSHSVTRSFYPFQLFYRSVSIIVELARCGEEEARCALLRAIYSEDMIDKVNTCYIPRSPTCTIILLPNYVYCAFAYNIILDRQVLLETVLISHKPQAAIKC